MKGYTKETNGVYFAIEKRVRSNFLWKTWDTWCRLLMVDFRANIFSNYDDAKKALDTINTIHEWREVEQ